MTLSSASRRRTAATAATDRDALRQAMVLTLTYADLFDYPLARDEFRRYLIGRAASAMALDGLLDAEAARGERIERTGEWFHLPGRGGIAAVRRRRELAAARLWPVARRYAGAIAQLPLVRAVAVSGALAMANAEAGEDVDLFILAHPGRVWLCRLLVLAVVKLAALRGHRLCPNFLLSTDRLALRERNLFTAHEVAQLVPVRPTRWYRAFVAANRWVADYLPNVRDGAAAGAPAAEPLVARLGSAVLGGRLFDRLERWEMERKIARLEARTRAEGGSVRFSKDECRGHFAAHDVRILAAFAARAEALAEGDEVAG